MSTLAVLSLVLALQDPAPTATRAATGAPVRTSVEQPTEVPMLSVGGRPAVEARVGDAEARMLIDTGTGVGLVLTDQAARRLGLTSPGAVTEVRVGSARFLEVPVSVSPLPPSLGVDGIFGLPLFAACTLDLDFARSRVRIRDQRIDARATDALPMASDPDMPSILTVAALVAGKPIDMHVDTGSPELALFSDTLEPELPLAAPPTRIGTARTPMGNADIYSATLTGDLVIGALRFTDPVVRIAGLPQVRGKRIGNLGCKALADTCITVDQRSQRILVRRSGPPSAAEPGETDLRPLPVAAIVEQVATLLENHYVFPDVALRYAGRLRAAAKAYPTTISAAGLASRITADLQAVHQDLHLELAETPSAAGDAARAQQRAAVVIGGPAAAPPSEAATPAMSPDRLFSPLDARLLPDVGRRLLAQEVKRNHFFRRVEVLPGNIGYIDYDQFGFPNFSTGAADAAFAFVSECDALILDLRGNRGGIEGMNQYLASHFFAAEPVHLYSRFHRAAQATHEVFTVPEHVKRRFPELPLFVLVDGQTGSAAENLSYALQGLGRATIVGEATVGAAHSSRPFTVEPGLWLQLPVSRVFDPRTGKDWEGSGVIPEVRCASASALAVAHGLAVDRLVANATDEERPFLEEAKALMASRDGSGVEATDPESYVGDYGPRQVFVANGQLKIRRTDVSGLRPMDLVAIGPDLFTLAQVDSARIRFDRDDQGRVSRIHVRVPSGAWESAERTNRDRK